MADFEFDQLKKDYESFEDPRVEIVIGGTDLKDSPDPLEVVRMEVELSSGFEASIAEFKLVGAYYSTVRSFDLKKAKKMLFLGSTVVIRLGYAMRTREVFRGFIARVHFSIPAIHDMEPASIEVTAMDIKGLMMANCHSKRLRSTIYCDAVKEILDAYMLKDDSGQPFTKATVEKTPDKQDGGEGGEKKGKVGGKDDPSDIRVEMVEESDYEFVVKIAKKFNFEFYSVGENVYFTPARSNSTPLIELTPLAGIDRLDVEYDITGLAKSVEVRSVSMDDGSFVGKSKQSKIKKISLGSKANTLVEKQKVVYLDSSVETKDMAGYRADYLLEMNEYRLGSLTAVCEGLPELIPGRFFLVKGAGDPLNNQFYITRVRHVMENGEFMTEIEGSANSISNK